MSAVLPLVIFLDLFGWGMVLPEVQLRSEKLGAPGWMIGLILMSTFAVQILTSPSWGRLGDRIGRKPVLVATTALSGLGLLLYGFAGSLGLILLSRIISGLGGANVAAAQAAAADHSTPETRPIAMGRIGAALSAGLIAGPALGAILSFKFPEIHVGLIAGASSLVGAILAAIAIPHQTPTAQEPGSQTKHKGFFAGAKPTLKRLFLVSATAWLGLALLEGTFGRLIERNFHQGAATYSAIFAYESLLGVIVQSVLIGLVTKMLGGSPLLRLSLILSGLGLAFTPFAPSIPLLIVFSSIYAVGSGLSNPTINALASQATSPEQQGELFGLLQSARSTGFIVGPLIGGALFDLAPAAPYITAGIACLAACILVPTHFESA